MASSANDFTSLDPARILSYGVIGLGFLLAFLAYRLLAQEQKKPQPDPSVIKAIYVFMGFSFALCVVGLGSEFLKTIGAPQAENPSAASAEENARAEKRFDDALASKRIAAAGGSTPDHFIRGHIDELQTKGLSFHLAGGECETFLAMAQDGTEVDVNWSASGVGAKQLSVSMNGDSNYRIGRICTAEIEDHAADVNLGLKMLRGSGFFALETYFASARAWHVAPPGPH